MAAVVKLRPFGAKKEPGVIKVIRRGKTFEYSVADCSADWEVLFENTVLAIRATNGCSYYWPLDSVTLWIIQSQPLNGHA